MPLIFDATDRADINAAEAAGGRVWYNEGLNRLKRKIKDNFTGNDTAQCCYCARFFGGEFNMVIDIEHVLPQDTFPTERFTITNLNIACKRCNMEIKKADTSFIVNILAMGGNYYQPQHYKIIHPNLEVYTDNIVVKTIRWGDLAFTKYVLRNQIKAKFTYNYFRLKELEIDTINQAQGGKGVVTLNSKISQRLRLALLKLLTKV